MGGTNNHEVTVEEGPCAPRPWEDTQPEVDREARGSQDPATLDQDRQLHEQIEAIVNRLQEALEIGDAD